MAIELASFAQQGDTALIAATTVSAFVTIPPGVAATAGNVRVYNDGPNLAFITMGYAVTPGGIVSSVKKIPLAVGIVKVFSKGAFDTFAAVTLLGTANVYFTPGLGG